jgi:tetratricopeptide (TPR) repeat protein
VADQPLAGRIDAPGGIVLVVDKNSGTINLTYPTGERSRRVFANVPQPGPPLVGRQPVLSALRDQLAAGGAVALHGLPGTGKSALALALAYDPAVLERFSGGVLWAGLGLRPDVDGALGHWATVLGVDVSAEPDVARRAQRLNAHLQRELAGQPFLIVLDDAWRLEDLAPFRYFATPGYALLLTTRDAELARRFAGTEAGVVRVEELTEDAAVDLLTKACPPAEATDPDGVRELARAVGGLPLALVLVGAELAANAGQPRWVRRALDRLRSAQARLTLRDEQPRPGLVGVSLTLQAVVELSVDALPDEATRLGFAQSGVFAPKPADFSRAAALAVWAVDEDAGDDRLQTLWRRGLLEIAGDDRFTLHQVLAAVAAARLDGAGETAARHFAHYLALVQQDPEDWRAIQGAWAQIQQAWAWAARTPGPGERVLQLVSAVHVFMERRGLRTQQRAWFQLALEAARALGDKREEGRLLGSLGLCWWELGEHGNALECYEQALALARDLSDRQAEGRHLGSIGLVWATLDRGRASDYYGEALAIAQEVGDRQAENSHLGALGLVEAEEGIAKMAQAQTADAAVAPYFQRAVRYYERALRIAREIGDRRGEGSHLGNLGNAWRCLGELSQAIDLLEQALSTIRDIGDRRNEGFHLANLGMAYQALGRVQAAQQCWQQAAAVFDTYGDSRAELVKTWLKTLKTTDA